MYDIINKILEMDEEARKLEDKTQAEKIASRQEVLKKKQEVYDEYLSAAKEHLETFKSAAKNSNEEKIKKAEQYYEEVSLALDKTFAQNKDRWIDEIVNGIIL